MPPDEIEHDGNPSPVRCRVVVEIGDVRAPGLPESPVPGMADPLIHLDDRPEQGIPRRVFPDHLLRVIDGAVVDDDDFERALFRLLIDERFEARFQ